MRQLGEKKKFINYMVLSYPLDFQVERVIIFFSSEEKLKLSLKEKSVPCFGQAREQQKQRIVCDQYKAVLCRRKMHCWSYVYPFKLADKGNCIFIHDKHLLYLNGFSLVLEINGLGIRFL